MTRWSVAYLMFGKWTYLIWLTAFLGIPLLGLGLFCWRVWLRERRALFWTLTGAGFGGWVWDYTAIQLGFWSFANSNLIGLNLLGLPLEEWLWIFGVTWLFGGIALILAGNTFGAETVTHACEADRFSYVFLTPLAFVPPALSQFTMTTIAGVVFHGILWARNGRFLRRCFPILLRVTALAVLWLLATDPIGAAWGAWQYDPNRVVGLWIFGLIPVEDILGIIVVGSAAAGAALVFAFSPRRWI